MNGRESEGGSEIQSVTVSSIYVVRLNCKEPNSVKFNYICIL